VVAVAATLEAAAVGEGSVEADAGAGECLCNTSATEGERLHTLQSKALPSP
jgi:hypothetical protein